jgi:hypothetical protein
MNIPALEELLESPESNLASERNTHVCTAETQCDTNQKYVFIS